MDNKLQFAEETICWFCKKEKVNYRCFFELDFHKVLERNTQYAVFGTQYKQKYITKKIQVPLCRECYKKSQKTNLVWVAAWFLLGIAGSYYYLTHSESGIGASIVNVLGAITAVALIFFAAAVVMGILYVLSDFFIETNESKAMTYPESKKLLDDGWETGDKPNYKWSS